MNRAQRTFRAVKILCMIFKQFPVCEFSLFDTPQHQFSGSQGSWSQCSHFKGSGLDLWSGMKIPLVVCYVIQFSSVRSLSRVQLFATPWTAAVRTSCPSPNPDHSGKLNQGSLMNIYTQNMSVPLQHYARLSPFKHLWVGLRTPDFQNLLRNKEGRISNSILQ